MLRCGGADTLERAAETGCSGGVSSDADALRPPRVAKMPGIDGVRTILTADDALCMAPEHISMVDTNTNKRVS